MAMLSENKRRATDADRRPEPAIQQLATACATIRARGTDTPISCNQRGYRNERVAELLLVTRTPDGLMHPSYRPINPSGQVPW